MDIIYIIQHWHFPDPVQIQVSITLGAITLFALWPLRILQHKVELAGTSESKARRHIIHLHAKERHKTPLKRCMQNHCKQLRPRRASRERQLVATLATEVAQAVHH
jgi:hypothetical protein